MERRAYFYHLSVVSRSQAPANAAIFISLKWCNQVQLSYVYNFIRSPLMSCLLAIQSCSIILIASTIWTVVDVGECGKGANMLKCICLI